MTTVAVILAVLAGLLHVGFFVMESLMFKRPAIHLRFGAPDAQTAQIQSTVFYNIGFYNLFLGLGAIVGAWMLADLGAVTLVAFTCLFMVGAALVLVTRSRAMGRAALIQGLFPGLALVALALA